MNQPQEMDLATGDLREGFGSLAKNLNENKARYLQFFLERFEEHKRRVAKLMPQARDAIEVCLELSRWFDAWVAFSAQVVQEEMEVILALLAKNNAQELAYHKKALEQKKEQAHKLRQLLFEEGGKKREMDPAEFNYYHKTLLDLEGAVLREGEASKSLEELEPLLEGAKAEVPLEHMVVIARGGFGRSELTFTSDVDIAYALDPASLDPLSLRMAQEFFRRLEELLTSLPADFASQYFELGEDLTRFKETGALHTIPSILEARVLLGNGEILKALKAQIRLITPSEKIIRYLEKQKRKLVKHPNNELAIKEGYGGIRHLQFALWMLLILFEPRTSNSRRLIAFAREQGMIGEVDEINLAQALEFYLSLRNFIGLYDYFSEELQGQGVSSLMGYHPESKNLLDDQLSLGYLRSVQRFTTVDEMDRFRLFSSQAVARLSEVIIQTALDRHVIERIEGFLLVKHLGSNEIREFFEKDSRHCKEGDEILTEKPAPLRPDQAFDRVQFLFLDFGRLFRLFLYISQKGNRLSRVFVSAFSENMVALEEAWQKEDPACAKEFLFQLFQGEYASVAIGQMHAISSPLSSGGKVSTLLGLFVPDANSMKFLLRNLKVHQYPLCEHSLRALEQVEKELNRLRQKEPELCAYIGEEDLFALKWSTFFHDLGKINPYRDHEELGPILSTKMLVRLGWNENHEMLGMIRLLVRHHQSVVRYTQLSTHMDRGILRYLDLADRDPKRMVLLYLVNLSDFKSVNDQMKLKAANLERFFEKTLGVLQQAPGEQFETLEERINHYLDQKLAELRSNLRFDFLFQQCGLMTHEEVLFKPLRQRNPQIAEALAKHEKELALAQRLFSLGETEGGSLEREERRFRQILGPHLTTELIEELVRPYLTNESWFFASMPNRYLLGVEPDVLPTKLMQFKDYKDQGIRFSFEKGQKGEYDTLLFSSLDDDQAQSKIAFVLGRLGMNIENGKINQVRYQDGRRGWVGFFQVSSKQKNFELNETELEAMIEQVILPKLAKPESLDYQRRNLQIQFSLDQSKPYIVTEAEEDRFERTGVELVALKVSLFDEPFYYFKMMMALSKMGVTPHQVTITTIGRQIIDYFYISKDHQKLLEGEDFQALLQDYLHFEIT